MTAVDHRTGEVVQQMTEAEALEFVSFILTAQEELPRRIIDAYQRRVWVPLGYSTWDEMCSEEGIQLRLPREERQQIVMEFRSAGMSTRAIGSALGTGDATVRRDLATASNDAVDQPATVTSLDGRQRPATQPPRAQDDLPDSPPEPVEDLGDPAPSAPGRVPLSSIRPEPKPRDYEQENAEQESAAFGHAVLYLSAAPEPDWRGRVIDSWRRGAIAATPVQRDRVHPSTFRAIADGLNRLADEWESR